MPATIDSTVGGVDANSYVTVVEADAYFDTRLNATAWSGSTTDVKTRALIQACTHLETLEWDPEMVGWPTSTTQKLRFPAIGVMKRHHLAFYGENEIPDFVKLLQFEQALFELRSDRTADPAGRGLLRVKADVLEAEFDDSGDAAIQRVIPDHVWKLGEPWLLSQPATGNSLQSVALERV